MIKLTSSPHLGLSNSRLGIGHLSVLIFEAVLEIFCIGLPGYFLAKRGVFTPSYQKFVAELNVQIFTPCFIFYKLASQLQAEKFSDLSIIPIIYILQTSVSYISARIVSMIFRLQKRPQNFVIAMAVFANSNSLPISLVIALSQTIKGLHWDRIPGDNDSDVAARGILYLLIFQQLGQLLRWSWGYHVLLAPAFISDSHESVNSRSSPSSRIRHYTDDIPNERTVLINIYSNDEENPELNSLKAYDQSKKIGPPLGFAPSDGSRSNSPILEECCSSVSGRSRFERRSNPSNRARLSTEGSSFTNYSSEPDDRMTSFPSLQSRLLCENPGSGLMGEFFPHCLNSGYHVVKNTQSGIMSIVYKLLDQLPHPIKACSRFTAYHMKKLFNSVWRILNPPLLSMFAAVVIAIIPSVQQFFFTPDTFVHNSITRSVKKLGSVAIPLILLTLGANIAQGTSSTSENEQLSPSVSFASPDTLLPLASQEEKQNNRNLLLASLISRLVLPTIIMAPILAVFAKFLPISIVDDPIFVVVCFLLAGAPSALQLAQICQLNNVYMPVMAKILFHSYILWIFPSTLILVLLAVEVLRWASSS